MEDRVCKKCYHVGKPIPQERGSFFVDALIWVSFFSVAMLSSFIPILLIPVAWTVYHLAVFNKSTCPECGEIEMVSLRSRKGKKALLGSPVVVTYRAPDYDERINNTISLERRNSAGSSNQRRSRRGSDQSASSVDVA